MGFGSDTLRQGSPQAIGATFYNKTIDQSLRFEDGDGAYLSKAYSTTQTNNKLITVSVWFKLGNLKSTSGRAVILHSRNGGAGEIRLQSDKLQANCFDTGYVGFRSEGLFRDTAAWYHIVYQGDSTNAVASARNRVWLNGQELTNEAPSFTPEDQVLNVLKTGQTTMVGRNVDDASHYWDGYLAEMHVIDGTLYGPEYFGENKNGIWIPKQVTGVTYGTNGFHLDFADSSDLGKNIATGNTFATFATSGLTASDQIVDSPTNNFCTLNSIAYSTIGTHSEGNLKLATSTNNRATHGTLDLPLSGKWYYEVRVDSYASGGGTYMGWGTDTSLGVDESSSSKGIYFSTYNEQVLLDNSGQSGGYGSTGTNVATNGDIYSILLDVDNERFYYAKNGTYFNSADPGAGTGGLDVSSTLSAALSPVVPSLTRGGSYNETYTVNFGQDATFGGNVTGANGYSQSAGGDFKYQPPTGFKALKVSNLPEPVNTPRNDSIENSFFYTTLYEGDGGGQRVGQFLPLNEVKTVNNAIRFEDGDTPHLTRTPGSSGNTKAWTWSSWVKRGNLVDGTLFSANYNSVQIVFSTDRVYFEHNDGSNNHYKVTTKKLRDTSVWYHIVCVWDTANGTAADRMRIYVDGERVTEFDSSSNPGSNLDSKFNTNIAHYIGYRINPAGLQLDGYMADVHFVDGQALDPTSFGQTDPSTETWIPKTFTGNHGQNGFHLEFENPDLRPGLGGIGDSSANNNHFTPVNLATANTVIDTPTRNFMTLGGRKGTVTMSEGNLKASAGSDYQAVFGSMPIPDVGKYYYEVYIETPGGGNVEDSQILIQGEDTVVSGTSPYPQADTPRIGYAGSGSILGSSGSTATTLQSSLTAHTAGTIFGVAVNMDDKEVSFYRNGSQEGNTHGFETQGQKMFVRYVGATTRGNRYNFGQDSSFAGQIAASANTDGLGAEFKYTPPAGYKALNTDNFPAKGTKGIARRKTPVITWIKNRDSTDSHMLFDQLRGPTKVAHPDLNAAETTEVNTLQKFLPGGFQIGNDVQVNTAGESYVAWNWCMHDDVVEEANSAISGSGFTDAKRLVDKRVGLSIVTYTASAGTGTIDHGLGQTPDMIIATDRGHNVNWFVWHTGLANAAAGTHIMNLDTGVAEFNPGINHLNDTAPTASAFAFGGYMGAHADTSASGQTKMLYAFKSVPGFSKFGFYTGNASADGTYVHLGFKPAWLMIADATTTNIEWNIYDTTRYPTNVMNSYLAAASSGAESVNVSTRNLDFVSNGIKFRDQYAQNYAARHIFWAMAEQPFKYANAR